MLNRSLLKDCRNSHAAPAPAASPKGSAAAVASRFSRVSVAVSRGVDTPAARRVANSVVRSAMFTVIVT